SAMSSQKVPSPRTNRGSSFRSIRPCPIGLWSLSTRTDRSTGSTGVFSPFMLGRPTDGAHDRRVAGAPTDLTRDGLADRLLVGIGVAVQQRTGRHHHPRGAEAALQAVALDEALLHRVQDAVALEVLDGADLVAGRHRGEHGAALHRLPVQPHHTGPAVAGVA